MKTNLHRIALLVTAVAFCGLLGTGCQTTKGFGRDVEKAGEKIQGK